MRRENEKCLLREKFIESCENLDTRILEPFLDEDAVLNGLPKYYFLAYLHTLFSEARETEKQKLMMVERYCRVCHPFVRTFEFYSTEDAVYYKFTLYTKELIEYRKKLIPVFAFARKESDGFDVEPCNNSWGFGHRRLEEVEDLRKIIYNR